MKRATKDNVEKICKAVSAKKKRYGSDTAMRTAINAVTVYVGMECERTFSETQLKEIFDAAVKE